MTTTMTQAIIDSATFADLQNTAGAEFAAELVGTFLEEAPGMLAALRSAHAAGDADAFRRAAHSIKSNAQTFGALRLGAMARELELGGLAAQGPGQEAALDEIEAAYNQAAATLQELCRG